MGIRDIQELSKSKQQSYKQSVAEAEKVYDPQGKRAKKAKKDTRTKKNQKESQQDLGAVSEQDVKEPLEEAALPQDQSDTDLELSRADTPVNLTIQADVNIRDERKELSKLGDIRQNHLTTLVQSKELRDLPSVVLPLHEAHLHYKSKDGLTPDQVLTKQEAPFECANSKIKELSEYDMSLANLEPQQIEQISLASRTMARYFEVINGMHTDYCSEKDKQSLTNSLESTLVGNISDAIKLLSDGSSIDQTCLSLLVDKFEETAARHVYDKLPEALAPECGGREVEYFVANPETAEKMKEMIAFVPEPESLESVKLREFKNQLLHFEDAMKNDPDLLNPFKNEPPATEFLGLDEEMMQKLAEKHFNNDVGDLAARIDTIQDVVTKGLEAKKIIEKLHFRESGDRESGNDDGYAVIVKDDRFDGKAPSENAGQNKHENNPTPPDIPFSGESKRADIKPAAVEKASEQTPRPPEGIKQGRQSPRYHSPKGTAGMER